MASESLWYNEYFGSAVAEIRQFRTSGRSTEAYQVPDGLMDASLSSSRADTGGV